MASKTAEARVLDAAREYTRRGWFPVPIPRGQKAPNISGWPDLRLTEADLPAHFSDGPNLGIILGAPSGGLCDVDCDCPEVITLADFFLPRTPAVFGRLSKPRSHRLYISEPGALTEKFADTDGAILVEIRSTGCQTVFPPSEHSNEAVAWSEDGEPLTISATGLRVAVTRLAAAALLARHWPVQGQRHNTALALAGMLLRGGITETETENFLRAVATAAHDEETRGRMRDVMSTAKRLAEGKAATGGPTLAQLVGDPVVARIREWLGLHTHAEVSSAIPSSSVQPWPDALAPEAFHGLAGEIVQAIEPHTEADPAAMLVQFLAGFGNVIGRGRFFTVEDHHHHSNIFVVIVGETSKARKGTSWARIEALLSRVDPVWASNRIHGGVVSGEGLIWAVRDSILRGEKLVDEGVSDKRLLVLETEFAQPLAAVEREGNTLSEVLRRCWDGAALQTLAKNSPARASGAHISMVGHITSSELVRHLSSTEIANGFANRFLFVCARRSKCLPEGGAVSEDKLAPLAKKLDAAVLFAREVGEMRRDDAARALWADIYPGISEGKPGLFGALISRSEAQILRLSIIFALLDSSAIIRREHLVAALAIWELVEGSTRFIFGDAIGDPVADEILRALRAKPDGMTRTEIHGLFGRNRPETEISRALNVLIQFGLAECREESTNGRPAVRWLARKQPYERNELNEKT